MADPQPKSNSTTNPNCCSEEHQVFNKEQEDQHHGHDHSNADQAGWMAQGPLLTALIILTAMLTLEYGLDLKLPSLVELAIFVFAYLLAGHNVLFLAYKKLLHFDIFNEFFLMGIATLGAFAIGAYSEGVAVMVFYSIGEWFQESAVNQAKRNIKALLDIRPDSVEVIRNGIIQTVKPSQVQINETIQVKPGVKVALDGELVSDKAVFNTAALTGENIPDSKLKGEQVLAGMINLNTVAEIKVLALFQDSRLSKILEMVQEATSRKSKTQLFISRFAKVYTPGVFGLALLLIIIPYFFVSNYIFSDWLYRSLVFLVISCPCALVVSIPLGYFGGIGLASKNGILFKGSNFLDVMTDIDTVVMDKTGTLTKGVFNVQKIVTNNFEEKELIELTAAIESKSNHPIALAITNYAGRDTNIHHIENVEEIPGHGLSGLVNGQPVLAGNTRLLQKFNIVYDHSIDNEADTIVAVAINNQFAGYFLIADEIKPDAAQTINELHSLHIHTVILSGDRQNVVSKVANTLGIKDAFGGLLPEDKVDKLENLKREGRKIAFVGDGVNDAPVIALADAGIAMGGLGSDATIETADIVIQNDQPSKIVSAIKIGKLTKKIVWQNIALAMGVKLFVLLLGAGGIATLWEAVIADVGVALLAIVNAVRIQRIEKI